MPASRPDDVSQRLQPDDIGRGDNARSGGERFETFAEAVTEVAKTLGAAGLEEPLVEARWLVASVAGLSSLDLLTKPAGSIDILCADRIKDCTRRRAEREPLSRILGRREFYGREFALSPGTLDPRPDTEVLVEFVLGILAQDPSPGRDEVKILDIGTGTGAILITLLAEYASAVGVGIDISADAIETAQGNAKVHGVSGRAAFEIRDIREGLEDQERFDFVVSNPPYIASADIAGLQPEVRCHDPAAALDGGVDGLDFYRIFLRLVGGLKPGGWLVVEVGAGQADDVARMMLAAAPGARLQTARDLGGHTRVVAVRPQFTPMVE